MVQLENHLLSRVLDFIWKKNTGVYFKHESDVLVQKFKSFLCRVQVTTIFLNNWLFKGIKSNFCSYTSIYSVICYLLLYLWISLTPVMKQFYASTSFFKFLMSSLGGKTIKLLINYHKIGTYIVSSLCQIMSLPSYLYHIEF